MFFPLGPIFAIAASYFSLADFPPFGPSSQSSSLNVMALPLSVMKTAAACFWWHLITARIALPTALPIESPHLR